MRGATKAAEIASWLYGFQSTLPVRGATPVVQKFTAKINISIHAPREGSDSFMDNQNPSEISFQSTLPVRGATYPTSRHGRSDKFQSTLPVRGATG